MKAKKFSSRLLAMLLTVMMVLSLLSTGVFAEGEGGAAAQSDTDPLSNLVLNKTAQLEDDGTYTVKLEAYAKGTVQTETVREPVPTDVILILDQSGSMDNNIDGIPSDTYSEANPTNAEVANGAYYYKVNDNYYRVTATKELISSSVQWVGDDGKIYTTDELSYSWNRKCDGQVYNTARPFVTSSLSTWTRSHTSILSLFYYVNDVTGEESSKKTSAKSARESFETTYAVNGSAVEFHNDGNPGTSTAADDPYYVAAVYIPVSQKQVNEYRYTYTYTDESGKVVTIGLSDVAAETVIDGTACAINPLYTRGTTTGSRRDALQYAANRFINDIRENALANSVDHRVAVIGFASSGSNYNKEKYENTELFVGDNQYRYNGTGNNAPSVHYSEALQSVSTAEGYSNLQKSVDALDYYGGTYPQYGFEMANGVFNSNPAAYTKPDGTQGTRSRIVIFMTDGEPGSGGNVDQTEASATIANAGISKDTYGAKVYTVAVLDSAPKTDSDQDKFLKSVSSDNTYTLATSTEALEGFFKEVSKDITSTTTTVVLSENALLVDQLSRYFVVPDGFSVENNIAISVATHAGDEAFNNPVAAPSGVKATLNTNNDGEVRGISVSGFNFISEDNIVSTSVSSGGSTIAKGNKLVVEIRGLLARDEAATGTYVDTNLSQSGIWDKDTDGVYGMIKAFPMPHTLLDKKLFVLDYAKETSLDVYNATKVDSAGDGLFSKVDETSTELLGNYVKYGKVSAADGLTYTPSTTNWDGYDSFYALGKDVTKGDLKTQNIWSKVSVIPANNVYYEDDFTTTADGSTVGIVYSGNWTTDGSSAGNTEDANGAEQGWIEDLADDTKYSDGEAHVLKHGATATFTFTGTGVDIYSRTNMETGLVRAQLYAGEDTTAAADLQKVLVVDNLAKSGDYYQIPTVSFSDLEHGTYTVKLTVGSKDGRSTYYLDGIRVYNPLSVEQEEDENVSDAYGDEIGATFMEVRDILIDRVDLGAGNATDGAVFIDYNPKNDTKEDSATTATIGTYEDYGPKNEVYLAKNQAVAFAVGEVTKLSVGLKTPAGSTTAQVTNGENTSQLSITGAADLYYEITPNADGVVIIKNTGDNLLSITKLKMSGDVIAPESYSIAAFMAYAEEFDTLPVVAYSAKPDAGSEIDPAEPENPSEDGNVVIENPVEDNKPEETPVSIIGWLANLFNGIKKLFGRF